MAISGKKYFINELVKNKRLEKVLLNTLADAGIKLSKIIYILPNNKNISEIVLEDKNYHLFGPKADSGKISDWLKENINNGRMPIWDIAASYYINNEKGLVLVKVVTCESELNAIDKYCNTEGLPICWTEKRRG